MHHGFCLIFKKIKSSHGLGSVSFKTWHPKVRFEYCTIFEGYLWAEIFEKQLWTFGQSLIFNVFSYILKIKDKLFLYLILYNKQMSWKHFMCIPSSIILIGGKIFDETVPPNNTLLGRTVPQNNTLFGGIVPPNNTLFGGTYPGK